MNNIFDKYKVKIVLLVIFAIILLIFGFVYMLFSAISDQTVPEDFIGRDTKKAFLDGKYQLSKVNKENDYIIVLDFGRVRLDQGPVFGYLEDDLYIFVYGFWYYTVINKDTGEIKQCINNKTSKYPHEHLINNFAELKNKIGDNYTRISSFDEFTAYEKDAFEKIKRYSNTAVDYDKRIVKYQNVYSVEVLFDEYLVISNYKGEISIYDKVKNKSIENDVYDYVVKNGRIYIYGLHGYTIIEGNNRLLKYYGLNNENLSVFTEKEIILLNSFEELSAEEKEILEMLKNK